MKEKHNHESVFFNRCKQGSLENFIHGSYGDAVLMWVTANLSKAFQSTGTNTPLRNKMLEAGTLLEEMSAFYSLHEERETSGSDLHLLSEKHFKEPTQKFLQSVGWSTGQGS